MLEYNILLTTLVLGIESTQLEHTAKIQIYNFIQLIRNDWTPQIKSNP